MEKCVDLHLHTTASDGSETPANAVALANRLRLAAIAVTDHDTAAGIPEALAAGEHLGVEVIPGIEVSADYNGGEVHIVGLFIDPTSEALRRVTEWTRKDRDRRNRLIVEAMAADGFAIDMDTLTARHPGSVLGRPHIAEYLSEKGYASSVKGAFEKYLAEGCPYYRPKQLIPMEQAAACLRASGGIAVLAHPLQYGYDGKALEAFLSVGKACGCSALEAYYSGYTPAETEMLLSLAARLGLGISGGSDWHGSVKPHIQPGSGINGDLHIPYTVLEALRGRRP